MSRPLRNCSQTPLKATARSFTQPRGSQTIGDLVGFLIKTVKKVRNVQECAGFPLPAINPGNIKTVNFNISANNR